MNTFWTTPRFLKANPSLPYNSLNAIYQSLATYLTPPDPNKITAHPVQFPWTLTDPKADIFAPSTLIYPFLDVMTFQTLMTL